MTIFQEKPNFLWPFMLVQAIQIVLFTWLHKTMFLEQFYRRHHEPFTKREVTSLVVIGRYWRSSLIIECYSILIEKFILQLLALYFLFIIVANYRRKKCETTNYVLVCVTFVFYNGISSEKEKTTQIGNYAENEVLKVNLV